MVGEFKPKLCSPFLGGLERNLNTALDQQIFDVAKADRKPVIEPDRIGYNLGGKAVTSKMRRLGFGHSHRISNRSRLFR